MDRINLHSVSARVAFLFFFCLLLVVSGCAARSSHMLPHSFDVMNKQPYTVMVPETVGGRETHPLWTSQISNSAFTEALSKALAKSGVFKTVIRDGTADYILDVTVLHYDQPALGLDFTIKMKTRWELTDAKTLKGVWSETFETSYKARVTDAVVAAERLRKANEGACRVNIKEGIKRLSAIRLQDR